MIPDPDSARQFCSPELEIRFTGNRLMRDPADATAFNKARYKWVKKKFGPTHVVAGGRAGLATPGDAPRWCGKSRAMHRKTTSPLRTHGRYEYSAITRRPDYSWPGRKRLAVYIGFNLEHFSFGEGMGAALGPRSPEPDVLNYSWRDYGNRVGAWRCLELFDSLKLPAGVILNTALYHYCPELIEACVKRGDELIGHGHTNSERQGEFSEEKERKLLQDCSNLIRAKSGKRPEGWLSPWISESHATPDLLAETGYRYTLNWCHDDRSEERR